MGDMADLMEERNQYDIAWHGKPSRRGLLNPLVVNQGGLWWDIEGNRHVISGMSYNHVLKCMCLCYTHALLRDTFPGSKLQDAFFKRLERACELASRYEDLLD